MTPMLRDATMKFLEYLKVIKNASEHTVRCYSIDLKAFCDYFKDTPLTAIDRKAIRGFVAHLSEHDKISKRALSRRLSALRSFFKYSLREKLVETHPMEDIELPKLERKIPTTLAYEQVKHLFNQPDTASFLGFRDRTMMELFYSSGLRVSELAGMNREDLDTNRLRILIRGKGKKERLIPITEHAASWICRYLEHPERYLDVDDHKRQVDLRAIFLNHRTSFRIVISPMYDQVCFNRADLNFLQNLFGKRNVFDFSGINKYTNTASNYYDLIHYKPCLAQQILKEIYN